MADSDPLIVTAVGRTLPAFLFYLASNYIGVVTDLVGM